MIKGTTKSGFKFSVDENVSDDMELIDALAELDDGNAIAFSKICKLILGEDQRKRLYDHLRNEDGRVPTSLVEKDLMDVLDSINKGKKSSSSPT